MVSSTVWRGARFCKTDELYNRKLAERHNNPRLGPAGCKAIQASEFHKRDAPMDEAIVAAIRRRLQAKITDMGRASSSGLSPGDSVEIANDEKRLGFPLPPLMKRIYVEIGNGGFGPGYGLIGLTNGVPDDSGNTAPDIYGQLRGADRDDPNWRWPQALLPICHWGCAILSCVDCTDSSFRMRIFDPNPTFPTGALILEFCRRKLNLFKGR
jgi:hypothetical protein